MKILTKKEKALIIRYAKSTAVSFLSGFAVGALPLLAEVNSESFGRAFIVGVVYAGFRSGVKAVAEGVGKLREIRKKNSKK